MKQRKRADDMKILSQSQTVFLEKMQVQRGASLYSLMQNAGTAAGRYLLEKMGAEKGGRVAIICGKGNNGGDGFVMARYLLENGVRSDVLLIEGETQTEISKMAFASAVESGVRIWRYWEEKQSVISKIRSAEFIVDALYGIGFKGELKDDIRELADIVNASRGKVIALDMPSGAQCDTGIVKNGGFEADVTITFSAMKAAQVLFPAMDYCGKTVVVQVGIDDDLIEQSEYISETIEQEDIKDVLPQGKISHNKGSYGTLFALCGSYGMAGAAQMSISAALRSGVGLVMAGVVKSIYPALAAALPQPVFVPLQETPSGVISKESLDTVLKTSVKASAFLMGCGLGTSEAAEEVVLELIRSSNKPIVLDADGINSICGHIDVLKEANCPIVITPHPGEMARLLKTTVQEVQANRLECAKSFAVENGAVTVLKGAKTIVASPSGKTFVCTRGSVGMAKGGSGDVLAGMIGAFIAQGAEVFAAAAAGVYLHAYAGERAQRRLSRLSVQPTDLIEELPAVYKEIFE